MSIFKIVDENGKFSSGGFDPTFGKDGKSWNTKGQVLNHLNANFRNIPKSYKNARLVEYVLTEHSSTQIIDLYERYNKLSTIRNNFGRDFANLYDTLEKNDQIEKYQWAASMSYVLRDDTGIMEPIDLLKEFNIKKNTVRITGQAFAMQDGDNLLKIKLKYAKLQTVNLLSLEDISYTTK